MAQHTSGFKELDFALAKLPGKVQRRELKKALRAAAKPIIKEARRRVPRRTGQLRKSIGVKLKTYNQAAVAIIGARSGHRIEIDGKPHDPVYIAHLVEMGTVHSLPHPFLRPAFDANKSKARTEFAKKLKQGIEKQAATK